MKQASRSISRWEVGDVIDNLTILELGDYPINGFKPHSCRVHCSMCGNTSTMRTESIQTRKFRSKQEVACIDCNRVIEAQKRERTWIKKLGLDEEYVGGRGYASPIASRNTTFDITRYKVAVSATKFSFLP